MSSRIEKILNGRYIGKIDNLQMSYSSHIEKMFGVLINVPFVSNNLYIVISLFFRGLESILLVLIIPFCKCKYNSHYWELSYMTILVCKIFYISLYRRCIEIKLILKKKAKYQSRGKSIKGIARLHLIISNPSPRVQQVHQTRVFSGFIHLY